MGREPIDRVQASGRTIAEASGERGVSASSVYGWKQLLAESPVRGRHWAVPEKQPARVKKSPGSTLPSLNGQVRGAGSQVNPAKPSDALDARPTEFSVNYQHPTFVTADWSFFILEWLHSAASACTPDRSHRGA